MRAALIFLNQPPAFGGKRILVNLSHVAFMKDTPEGTQIILSVEGRSNRLVVEETMDQIVAVVTSLPLG